jgi:hypothetical protein
MADSGGVKQVVQQTLWRKTMRRLIMIGTFALVFAPALAAGQRRWLDYVPAGGLNPAFHQVRWDSVAAIVFYNTGAKTDSIRLHAVRGAAVQYLGTVRGGSASINALKNLVAANQARWLRYRVQSNGAYLSRDRGVGYADINHLEGLTYALSVIDFNGHAAWMAAMGQEPIAIVEDPDIARVQKAIDDSVRP